ncbi:MAG: transposase [Planctomycetota bacterium]|jgi:putative transposase
MPRPPRIIKAGIAYHLLNRANGRLRIFRKVGDFRAFEDILAEAVERFGVRLTAYCIMGNHWHMVAWPEFDDQLSHFIKWLTVTHAQRWHAAHGTAGMGHIYQGRYKSFPVASDGHYLTVLRYVESNPLRAGIVRRSQEWPWSSLAVRNGKESDISLSDGPVELPSRWNSLVNVGMRHAQLESIQRCVKRGCPCGESLWVERTAEFLRLESTCRRRGRPNKGVRPL